jgi:glycosyltransferase involved in cell wall biosynthesis
LILGLAVACALAALLPALLFRRNLGLYAPPPPMQGDRPAISILIPARNEEGSIRGAVEAALASEGAEIEVIVLDDHSEDRTAAIVREIAARDPRACLEPAPPLPAGWNGKQHACAVLGRLAQRPLLLLAGQVMPPLLLLLALLGAVPGWVLIPAAIGTAAAYLPRLAAVRRFRQPLDGALLHPLGISIFLVLQWVALGRKMLGRPAGWKGRTYGASVS